VFFFQTKMTKGRALLGYREILLKEDCMLGRRGDKLKGHEFHYSEIIKNSYELRVKSYKLKDGTGNYIYDEGYKYKNTLASYVHVHFGSNCGSAGEFMNFIRGK
ncbi:MAG: cobyrinic acid a,c-diamide synthase, partial [Nitrospirae bacterium]|nr:cobyrinic acid a,c-diamide synthase [Nitrospirota bacterium]